MLKCIYKRRRYKRCKYKKCKYENVNIKMGSDCKVVDVCGTTNKKMCHSCTLPMDLRASVAFDRKYSSTVKVNEAKNRSKYAPLY